MNQVRNFAIISFFLLFGVVSAIPLAIAADPCNLTVSQGGAQKEIIDSDCDGLLMQPALTARPLIQRLTTARIYKMPIVKGHALPAQKSENYVPAILNAALAVSAA